MLAWLSQNISTIIVAMIVTGIVALVLIGYFKDKKKHKGMCAGCSGCVGCACAGKCIQKEDYQKIIEELKKRKLQEQNKAN